MTFSGIILFASGICLGAAVCLLWVGEKLRAYYADAENHRYAAMELSRSLAMARRENEALTEQVSSLLSDKDPSEAWKEAK